MIFYLLRHGRSVANEAGLVTGNPSDSLCINGQAQVGQMKVWLEQSGLIADRYVTSHWARARETAVTLFPEENWKIDPRVGETNAGLVADFTLHDFLREQSDFYANPANSYPGGESHLNLNARVLAWFYEELSQPCGSVMLVAHSGPISCILQHILGIGMESFPALTPGNASLSIIQMRRSKSAWKGQVLGFSMGPSLYALLSLIKKQSHL